MNMSQPQPSEKAHSDGAIWQAFVEAPLRCIDQRRLSACLGEMADPATQEALAQHPRFRQRLTQRLIQQYALPPPQTLAAPSTDDLPLLQLPPDSGDTLARYCGAICHARAFVREIRAPRVIELKERFGEALFATALANRELAIFDTPYRDDDALADAIEHDGHACLTVWLAGQSPGLAAWLRLGIAADSARPHGEISDAIHQRGAAITQRAATAIVASLTEEPA